MDFVTLIDITIELLNMKKEELIRLENYFGKLIDEEFNLKIEEESKTKRKNKVKKSVAEDIMDKDELENDEISPNDKVTDSHSTDEQESIDTQNTVVENDDSIDIVSNNKLIDNKESIKDKLIESNLINELKGLKVELKEFKEELVNQRKWGSFEKKIINQINEDNLLHKKETQNHLKGGDKMSEEEKMEIEVEEVSLQQTTCGDDCVPIDFCCTVIVPEGYERVGTGTDNVFVAPNIDCLECMDSPCTLTPPSSCTSVTVNQIMVEGCVQFLVSMLIRPVGTTDPDVESHVCCTDLVCIPDPITVCYSCKTCTDLDLKDEMIITVTDVTENTTVCPGDTAFVIEGTLTFDCN